MRWTFGRSTSPTDRCTHFEASISRSKAADRLSACSARTAPARPLSSRSSKGSAPRRLEASGARSGSAPRARCAPRPHRRPTPNHRVHSRADGHRNASAVCRVLSTVPDLWRSAMCFHAWTCRQGQSAGWHAVRRPAPAPRHRHGDDPRPRSLSARRADLWAGPDRAPADSRHPPGAQAWGQDDSALVALPRRSRSARRPGDDSLGRQESSPTALRSSCSRAARAHRRSGWP